MPAYFTLHIRLIFLYTLALELPDQCGQPQHVFDPGHGAPSGQDHKGVRLANISPIRGKIGQLPILGRIVDRYETVLSWCDGPCSGR